MDTRHPLQILHLEDDVNDAELVRTMLVAEGIVSDVTLVQSRDEFSSALNQREFNLIISDFTLPSFNGAAALAIAREKCPDVPFIFLSGTIGEDAAIESLLEGAVDYVFKQKPARFVPAVRRALREAEERKKRRRTEEERNRLILELRDALANVRQLGKLLPICASCKKIRDDKGYWTQVERYVMDNSDATFSHGVCPECAQRLYPDLYKIIMNREGGS